MNQGITDDHCIFIRGFRVFRPFGVLPKQLRGAAGFRVDQSQYGDHDDDELPMDLVPLPTATMVKYPSFYLHFPPFAQKLQSIVILSAYYRSTLPKWVLTWGFLVTVCTHNILT